MAPTNPVHDSPEPSAILSMSPFPFAGMVIITFGSATVIHNPSAVPALPFALVTFASFQPISNQAWLDLSFRIPNK